MEVWSIKKENLGCLQEDEERRIETEKSKKDKKSKKKKREKKMLGEE